MDYVPFHQLGGRSNIIVDGYPADGTVLTLSHWPGAGTPEDLADDLSTQIALRYLDRPDLAVHADAVSNNHFDEDGLCGIYSLLHPDEARSRRETLIDIASAGDFGTFRSRDAARAALTIMAYADEDRSPLASSVFRAPYPEQAATLYGEMLVLLPDIIDHPDRFKDLWREGEAHIERTNAALASGAIRIRERPDIDLAIVEVDKGDGPDIGEEWSAGAHPWAIHNATQRHRVLVTDGTRHVVRYRYETWVAFKSRPTLPRVDLAPLASELSALENDTTWTFDDIDGMTPALHTPANAHSAISSSEFIQRVEAFLTA
jgi:hypothetical protein